MVSARENHLVDRRLLGGDGGERVGVGVRGLTGGRRPVARQERQAPGQRGQHAEREQVHLEESQLGEVVLVPLDHRPPGHGGRLHRHGLDERPLRDDEAPHVDGEVAREAGDLRRQPQCVSHRRRSLRVEPGLLEHRRWDLAGRVAAPHELGQAVDLIGCEAECLAHVANGRAGPVADDLADHAGPVATVALVDVLDDLLAPLVLEVDVDVGRLAPLRGEEALEEQPHANRVDGGDAEHEADGRVGRAAAPLAEDPAGTREADQVPDGEEVALVPELLDEVDLPGELPLHVGGHSPAIPGASTLANQTAEQVDSAHPRIPFPGPFSFPFPGRGALGEDRRQGMLPADLLEPEGAPGGDLRGRLQPLREVGPQARHLLGPLHRALGVGEEAAPHLVEAGSEPDAGEDVLQGLAPPVVGMDVVHHRHADPEPPSHAANRGDSRLLAGGPVARHRQREALAEGLLEPGRRVGVGAAVEGEEAASPLGHRQEGKPDRGSRPSLVGLGEQATEPGVALAIHGEQRHLRGAGAEAVADHRGADDEWKPALASPGVGANHAVEAVAIGKRQRLEPQVGGAVHQLLRVARALQEGEVGAAAQLGVAGRHGPSSVEEAVDPEPAVAAVAVNPELAQAFEPGPVVIAVEGLAPPLSGEPLRPGDGEDGAGFPLHAK